MVYEGNELIGFLLRVYLIILFSGILALLLVPVEIKSDISIFYVFLVAFLTTFIALRIDCLSAWFTVVVFMEKVLNLWH